MPATAGVQERGATQTVSAVDILALLEQLRDLGGVPSVRRAPKRVLRNDGLFQFTEVIRGRW